MTKPGVSGQAYAESTDGIHWEKPELDIIRWNGTDLKTNLVVQYQDGTGVMIDEHEDTNSSRRYKLIGGLAFEICKNRPSSSAASDGTVWPPCKNYGQIYSRDGIHFEFAQNGSATDKFYDVIGQNDGTLNVAVWDADLGAYWGLVRLDAGYVGRDRNPRRTGRFTSPDFRTNFSASMQVFNGTDDYQVYAVIPWRLPSYRPGYYLGIASFLLTNQTVRTEILQTTDLVKARWRFGERMRQWIEKYAHASPVKAIIFQHAFEAEAAPKAKCPLDR